MDNPIDQITERTIVKIDVNSKQAENLLEFAKEHPFLEVTLHQREGKIEGQERIEFHTHKCSKATANRRFFYFLLIYAEWLRYANKN